MCADLPKGVLGVQHFVLYHKPMLPAERVWKAEQLLSVPFIGCNLNHGEEILAPITAGFNKDFNFICPISQWV